MKTVLRNIVLIFLKLPVSKIEANDYVDEIVNAKPEDYKAAMGLTVKAQVPGTNKILTLEEGKDYTVKYDIINNGTEVKASVTLNTSATANFVILVMSHLKKRLI